MRGPPPGWPVTPREPRRRSRTNQGGVLGSSGSAAPRAFPPPELALIETRPVVPHAGLSAARLDEALGASLMNAPRAEIGIGDAPFDPIEPDFDDMPTFTGHLSPPVQPGIATAQPTGPMAPPPPPPNVNRAAFGQTLPIGSAASAFPQTDPLAAQPNPAHGDLRQGPPARPVAPTKVDAPATINQGAAPQPAAPQPAAPQPAELPPLPVVPSGPATRIKVLLAVLLLSIVGMGIATFIVMRSPSSDDDAAPATSTLKKNKKARGSSTASAGAPRAPRTTSPRAAAAADEGTADPVEEEPAAPTEEPAQDTSAEAAPTAVSPKRAPGAIKQRIPSNVSTRRNVPRPAQGAVPQ